MHRLSTLAVLLLAPVALAADPWRPDARAFTRAAGFIGFLKGVGGDDIRPTDGVAAGVLVLAEKNKRYVVYAPSGGRVNLKIPAGDWRVKVYNPRTGEWGKKTDEKADDGGLTLKFATDGDWAAVLVRD